MQRRCFRVIAARQDGFTLLEIMVVLAIIGLITAAVGVSVYKRFRDAQIKAAQLQVQRIIGDAAQFLIMRGTCPTAEALVADQYLSQLPRDPWGSPMIVQCPGEHPPDPIDVVSWGPDKQADTSDDIKSWVR